MRALRELAPSLLDRPSLLLRSGPGDVRRRCRPRRRSGACRVSACTRAPPSGRRPLCRSFVLTCRCGDERERRQGHENRTRASRQTRDEHEWSSDGMGARRGATRGRMLSRLPCNRQAPRQQVKASRAPSFPLTAP
jgi:hypothetical protein